MGTAEEQEHPLLGFARGDAAWASQLQASLRTLAADAEDPQVGAALLDVAEGRASMRSLLSNDRVGELIIGKVAPALKRMKPVDTDQIQALHKEAREAPGARILDELDDIVHRLSN